MIVEFSLCGRRRPALPKGLGALWLAVFLAAAPCAWATEKHPALAEPSRPVALPTLPGGKEMTTESGLMLHVTSTDDEAEEKQAAEDEAQKKAALPKGKPTPLTPAYSEPETGGYSEQNWRPAKQQAQHADEESGKTNLHVRLPGLPDTHVTIAPVDKGPSAAETNRAALLEEYKHAKDQEAAREKEEKDARAGKKKKEEKSPAEAAACEALQAYKERQLNAIKSDNETLKALQDAISALGYEKQLNYMRSSGDLAATPEATTPQAESKPAAKSVKTKKPTS